MSKQQQPTPQMQAAIDALDRGVPFTDVMRWLDSVHIKNDPLEGWTGSPPFHLDRLPSPQPNDDRT